MARPKGVFTQNNYQDTSDPDVVELELTRRNKPSLWTKIDRKYLETVRQTGRLAVHESCGCIYAIFVSGPIKNKYLHQSIFKLSGKVLGPDQMIDHENRNGLDNRSSNLRPANSYQNNQNRSRQSNNQLGLQNISLTKNRDKCFHVHIKTNGNRYQKLFYTLPEAISARDFERAKRGLPPAEDLK